MKHYTVLMSIVDFVPVILFAVAAIILQCELYRQMRKGTFALFSVGTLDIICAGGAKALYKLLYAAGICDFKPLSDMFFPVQSLGFMFAGIGMLAMILHRPGKDAALSVVPPVFTGTMVFVSCMCLGQALVYVVLCILCVKLKKPFLIAVFVTSFLCSLTMGYLSTKDFAQSYMNWIAEITNIIGQGLLLYGVAAMKKEGLSGLKIRKKGNNTA